jgi:peptidyl-tRNA hydrolase, PTH1 family
MLRIIIIGLGNIGFIFKKTPHNIGFEVLKSIAEKYKIKVSLDNNFFGYYGEKIVKIEDKKIILGIFYPYTMMNLSGKAVKKIVTKLESLNNMLICTDNKDLPVGKIKLKLKGRSEHHNGIASIDNHLGTKEYPRMRIGTGKTKVLERMLDEDINICINKAVLECEKWIKSKLIS